MLTRLEVNGFKNLVDFSLDFGPYTCIAGPNGVGKSNIFDAIRFLSLLTEHTINDAALQIRNAGEETGDIADPFFYSGGERAERMEFAVEMIVGGNVRDDFGREAEASSSFLRYEVAFRYEPPAPTGGLLGGLVLEREELRPITTGRAVNHLRFPHSKSQFRDSVVYNKRHARSGFISTQIDPESELAAIVVHQDGGSHGRGRPSAAGGATRTIVGTENTVATPTILAARREMQSWKVLALDPAAMRRPDRYTQPPGIATNGAHIPATLQHLANIAPQYDDEPENVFAAVPIRLSSLVPMHMVRVAQDDVRQLLLLELEEYSGVKLRANSISDGTLRFLALVAMSEVFYESGVFCMEEPENGIHPAKLAAMNRLLHDIAFDPDEAIGIDNPLRQLIVATHSPYFVQLQNKENLVLAKSRTMRSETEEPVENVLQCEPYHGTWRCSDEGEGISLLSLQSYLMPPEETQIALPREFWESL
ncbi:MAG: AAA family ATPase [Chloroflexi bacterium]|nr:AAA family ATPase [Chloroflexota bacterium]